MLFRSLRVFENRTLRLIIGTKKDENGEWRRFHNENHHSLYRLPNRVRVIKSRRLRCASHVARMEEGLRVSKILISKLTGKIPLGRSSHRWEDITMDLKEATIRGSGLIRLRM